jgi:hypothetical protein
LPPNKTPPEGEGYVTFSVDLKKNLLSGTEIKNRATIVFDINPPITTNTWKNVLDTIAPKTIMNAIKYANGDTIINISCTSNDNANGSGAGKYAYFVSVNNEPFKLIGESSQNSIQYPVSQKVKNNYRFYALASDNVSNAEQVVPQIVELKSIPLSNQHDELFNGAIQIYPNPTSGIVSVEFSVADECKVELKLYSVTGELIKNTGSMPFAPGQHQIKTDISNLKQGIYFAQVMVGKKLETFKIVKN